MRKRQETPGPIAITTRMVSATRIFVQRAKMLRRILMMIGLACQPLVDCGRGGKEPCSRYTQGPIVRHRWLRRVLARWEARRRQRPQTSHQHRRFDKGSPLGGLP